MQTATQTKLCTYLSNTYRDKFAFFFVLLRSFILNLRAEIFFFRFIRTEVWVECEVLCARRGCTDRTWGSSRKICYKASPNVVKLFWVYTHFEKYVSSRESTFVIAAEMNFSVQLRTLGTLLIRYRH